MKRPPPLPPQPMVIEMTWRQALVFATELQRLNGPVPPAS